jgi:hypothetical protein
MHPSDKSYIGSLALAVTLGIALTVFIGAMGQNWGGMDFDPQWVENALTGLLVVGCWWLAFSAWRGSYALCQFVAFLRGDVSQVSPMFAGILQRFAQAVEEEAKGDARDEKTI